MLNSHMVNTRTLLAAVSILVLLTACASVARSPESAPEATAGEGRAPLRIEITAARATEPAYMRQHVTPLRVEIENGGAAPLRLAYEDLVLIDEAGAVYSVLPLFELDGDAAAGGQGRVDQPGFQGTQFSVAGPYASVYPSLSAFDGPFHIDGQYNGYYHAYWASIPLPTQEMLNLGLPEGVLGPGGKLSGLLYFEYSGGGLPALRLRGDFLNPFTGERLGTATVPVR